MTAQAQIAQARTFSAITDIVATGLTSYAQQRSYAIWARRTGAGGSNFGRLWTRTTGETEGIFNDEAAATYRFFHSFSVTSGGWTIVQPSVNVWHHIVVVYDASSVLNVPTIYVDGASVTVTTLTPPVGTDTSASDAYSLGNRNSGSRQWAGDLCQFAVWNTLLSAGDVANVFARSAIGALTVQNASIQCDYVFRGVSPEPDVAGVSGNATVTGTVVTTGPNFSGQSEPVPAEERERKYRPKRRDRQRWERGANAVFFPVGIEPGGDTDIRQRRRFYKAKPPRRKVRQTRGAFATFYPNGTIPAGTRAALANQRAMRHPHARPLKHRRVNRGGSRVIAMTTGTIETRLTLGVGL